MTEKIENMLFVSRKVDFVESHGRVDVNRDCDSPTIGCAHVVIIASCEIY